MTPDLTEIASSVQAERPMELSVRYGDSIYSLKWEQRRQKYRLRLGFLPGQKDTYYNADPTLAVREAEARLPKLFALLEPVEKPAADPDQPKHLAIQHKGVEYTLTLHRKGEYRRKFAGQDKYFGVTPDAARESFYYRIDGILAGKDPWFEPEGAQPIDELNPTFTVMVDDAIGYKKSRVGISLAEDRFSNLERRAKFVKKCAEVIETHPANAKANRMLAATKCADIRAAHLEKLIAKLHETHNLITLDDDLQFLRMVFNRANRRLKSDAIDIMVKETLASVPQHKKEAQRTANKKHYEREEILALYGKADPQWRAMILLGINGALEPGEISLLDWSYVDLEGGWYGKGREKIKGRSNAPRLFYYWQETIDALSIQPTRLKGGRVFLTSRGQPWVGGTKRSFHNAFSQICEDAKVERISGRGFKGLRHSFRTFADKCIVNKEFCLNLIMGHTQKHSDMGRIYNGQTDDFLVRHYCEFVREWVYNGERKAHQLTGRWQRQEGKAWMDMQFQGVA